VMIYHLRLGTVRKSKISPERTSNLEIFIFISQRSKVLPRGHLEKFALGYSDPHESV
jgi:hypothetical protein